MKKEEREDERLAKAAQLAEREAGLTVEERKKLRPRKREKGEQVEPGIWTALVLRDGAWQWEKGDGYIAEVSYRDTHTRQRVRERKHFNRLDLARAWIQTEKSDAIRGIIEKKKKKSESVTFGKFAEEYLKAWTQERKDSTADREGRRIRGALISQFGHSPCTRSPESRLRTTSPGDGRSSRSLRPTGSLSV